VRLTDRRGEACAAALGSGVALGAGVTAGEAELAAAIGAALAPMSACAVSDTAGVLVLGAPSALVPGCAREQASDKMMSVVLLQRRIGLKALTIANKRSESVSGLMASCTPAPGPWPPLRHLAQVCVSVLRRSKTRASLV
jgi:hypothetical protein